MKKVNVLIIFAVICSAPVSLMAGGDFDQFFLDKTMRVDYYHTGVKDQDIISLDAVYEEPAVMTHGRQLWAGSKVNLIDTFNFGKYMVKVIDVSTNRTIYSRGYSSIFGEWQTTDEAANGIYKTFHESVIFPYPKNDVQVVLLTRDKRNHFHEIFSTVIDPSSRFVNRESHDRNLKVRKVRANGDPSKKVDLLILGDGFTTGEINKFNERVDHFTSVLFNEEPFRSRKKDFNVWAVEKASLDSGIDEPRQNKWRKTAFGCSYNSFDSPRYVLTMANRAIRNAASAAPYDQIYLILNSDRYGGGGIFNLFSTCYSYDKGEYSSWWTDYVFVHEFGHAFAGLGDEYYSSSVAYNDFYPQGVDPWEPNVGIIEDGVIKWGDMMASTTPVPTEWDKTVYDSLSNARYGLDRSAPGYSEKLKEIAGQMESLLRSQKYWGKVGAFQGSGYASEGLYRPYLDCRMFSKSLTGFCPVCSDAISRMIDFYSE